MVVGWALPPEKFSRMQCQRCNVFVHFHYYFREFWKILGYYGTRKDYEKKITMKRTHTMADMMSKLLENPWENVNISGRRENRNLLQTINISAAT